MLSQTMNIYTKSYSVNFADGLGVVVCQQVLKYSASVAVV